ncbi:hypothetical protein WJX72_008800 [[Myrmecia] bisecta]|uniref:Origin recognition complex subunit 2 n=1 Tax=[Myrmecia] bisecta TaxID=41462 RepID=A0AAW1PXT7_9CHLO
MALGAGKKTATVSLSDFDLKLSADQSTREILSELPAKHANEKAQLRQEYEEHFHIWPLYLKQGFSLLFYGVGSKRALLQQFVQEALPEGGVLEINGLFATLTVRQVLVQAAGLLKRAPASHFAGMDSEAVLQEIQGAGSTAPLYILLHNIEGPGLRSADAQRLVSELAACDNVHLVASMDHVNTPVLWDNSMAGRFNWLYFHMVTYAPYIKEVKYVPSLLVGRSETCTTQAAAVVLKTLVPKARSIFRIIAEQQEDSEEAGISFPRLYKMCREKFLVSNEMTLRSHLTEFKDHDLLASKRGQDGTDLLYIPLADDTLQQVLLDMESGEGQ